VKNIHRWRLPDGVEELLPVFAGAHILPEIRM